MKQLLTITTLLLILTLSACSKDQNLAANTDTDQDIQVISESIEQNHDTKMQTEAADQTNATIDTAAVESTSTKSETVTPNYPIVMETPSFAYYNSNQTNITETPAVSLDMSFSESNNITDTELWFQQNNLLLNQYECVDSTSCDLPSEIDNMYQDLKITSAFYDDSYIYCLYGTNYSDSYMIKIYDKNTYKSMYTLDFSNYMFAPDAQSGEALEFPQQITWASIKDGILYISNRHRTYASTTNNENAYITAIDLKDLHIVWRSDALISNAENFLLLDNVIICGYGFTDEDDYLYELDQTNGKVINTIPLKSAPSYIIQKGNQIYVKTYNMNYIFNIIK